MKLLFVNGHLNAGGVEKSLIDLLKSIDYTEHQVDLLLFEGYGDYLSQIPSSVNIIMCDLHSTYGAFVPSILNNMKNGDFRSVLLKVIFTLASRLGVKYISLMKLLKITPKDYDCAIAYRVGICSEYVAFALNTKKKYMWWHHGEFNFSADQVKRWRDTSLRMNKIVCVSEFTKNMILPYVLEKKNDLEVIPNMVLPEEIEKKAYEKNPYEDVSGLKLVSVGRMSPEKHMLDCVKTMDILFKKGYKDLKWYLVGDGIERNQIEQTIISKNLQDNVFCVGSQNNPYPYIAHADIFVHPSYVESQGLAVLEALTLKRASVITKSDGVCEFIINNQNGVLVEKGPLFLADAIIDLIENEYKRELLQYQTKCPPQFLKEKVLESFYRIIHEPV